MNNTRKNSKTWLIIQYDDRPLTELYNRLIDRNKYYCNKHGYIYKFISSGYENLPPYWRKVKIVLDYLNSDKYKGIMWLDTDATIFNFDIKLGLFDSSNNTKSFYKSINSVGNKIFNAGVWIVKNTIQGKQIMNDWMNLYDPNTWYKKNGAWHTNGYWADIDYEQGSFAFKVIPKYNNNIKTLNEPFLQGLNKNGANAKAGKIFVLYFYSNNKEKIEPFLKSHPLPNA